MYSCEMVDDSDKRKCENHSRAERRKKQGGKLDALLPDLAAEVYGSHLIPPGAGGVFA